MKYLGIVIVSIIVLLLTFITLGVLNLIGFFEDPTDLPPELCIVGNCERDSKTRKCLVYDTGRIKCNLRPGSTGGGLYLNTTTPPNGDQPTCTQYPAATCLKEEPTKCWHCEFPTRIDHVNSENYYWVSAQ